MLCCQSCPLVNDCDLLAGFFDFYPPSPIWRRGFPRAIGFIFGTGNTRMACLQSGERRMMLFGHNTSTWQTHRQPRRHSKWRACALRRAAQTRPPTSILYIQHDTHMTVTYCPVKRSQTDLNNIVSTTTLSREHAVSHVHFVLQKQLKRHIMHLQ